MTELDPVDRPQLLDILREMLPSPVKEETLPEETTRLIAGDPGDVVVDVSDREVIVAEYAVTMESDTARILKPLHLGSLNWTELPAWTTRRILGELTAAATAGRREKFRECIRCHHEFPPEAMANQGICKACAAAEEGVVY